MGERAECKKGVSLTWMVPWWPGHFQVIFWKTYKVWQFRYMAGPLLSTDRGVTDATVLD